MAEPIIGIPDWADQICTSELILNLGSWNGVVRHMIEVVESGAILHWSFSNPLMNPQSVLFVRLTDEEARVIVDTDLSTTGILDNVRGKLSDPHALIMTMDMDTDERSIMPFIIEPEWTEAQLVSELLLAVFNDL